MVSLKIRNCFVFLLVLFAVIDFTSAALTTEQYTGAFLNGGDGDIAALYGIKFTVNVPGNLFAINMSPYGNSLYCNVMNISNNKRLCYGVVSGSLCVMVGTCSLDAATYYGGMNTTTSNRNTGYSEPPYPLAFTNANWIKGVYSNAGMTSYTENPTYVWNVNALVWGTNGTADSVSLSTNIVNQSRYTSTYFTPYYNGTVVGTNASYTCRLTLNGTLNSTSENVNLGLNNLFNVSTVGWDLTNKYNNYMNITCNNTYSSGEILKTFFYDFVYTVNGTVVDTNSNLLTNYSIVAVSMKTNQTLNYTTSGSTGFWSISFLNTYGLNITLQAFNLSSSDTKGAGITSTTILTRDII